MGFSLPGIVRVKVLVGKSLALYGEFRILNTGKKYDLLGTLL